MLRAIHGVERLPVADPTFPLPALREGMWHPYSDNSTPTTAIVTRPHDKESHVLQFSTLSRHVKNPATIIKQVKQTIGHADVLFISLRVKFRMSKKTSFSDNDMTAIRAFFGGSDYVDIDMLAAARGKVGVFMRYVYVAMSGLIDVEYILRLVCRTHWWLSSTTHMYMVCNDGSRVRFGSADIPWTLNMREFVDVVRKKDGLYIEVLGPGLIQACHVNHTETPPPKMPLSLRMEAAQHPCQMPHGKLLCSSFDVLSNFELPTLESYSRAVDVDVQNIERADADDIASFFEEGSVTGVKRAREISVADRAQLTQRRVVVCPFVVKMDHVFPSNSYGHSRCCSHV